ncbi:MAG: hypothetical protein A3I75_02910 [Deltaproteobacteria bacterium RIFCSPLOWO2_02_FULL_50_16]|nr:MAG: hypothetical protein A2053_05425 [Deltaproteobacteria bacterium GWA2_50_8]OGQ26405.1 MAG: hypothetical protein A3B79_06900 [Deltaproteobacteria bacterium RIFCSPHIGHO2_02_FULL_50_15]OGQ56899.1 MAG: hypothetical protein A3I75_02910 [Deltaproteobacteria bacterium RIFCSPLOWO2_02_FULL_50_16]OGQ67923.1 MAG: hypothetical protein A3F89_03330 [Deltaproteobacteria bacterium RIFCSPLOWO2_12_FULL_50_11]
MSEKVQLFILFFPVFLFSLSFHESAHAWMAHKCGDPTAKMLGRLSLNPLVHMDFIGTFLLPLIVFLAPGLAIPIAGWAKPVPVAPMNFRNIRRDNVKVAAAGPVSNLILAVLFSLFIYLYVLMIPLLGFTGPHSFVSAIYSLLRMGIYINLGLAFFNMIPVHPLDGGKILEGFLPDRLADLYNQWAHYGILIIFVAYYLGLMRILWIPVRFISRFLIPF